MFITIMDYRDDKTTVDVGNLEDIARMTIEVKTGDEILHVIYKNYRTRSFDSSRCRMADFYDGDFDIYDVGVGLNILDDPNFIGRTHYSLIWNDWEVNSEGKIVFREDEDYEEA